MPDSIQPSRREFLKTLASGAAGAGLVAGLPEAGHASFAVRRSAAETVRVAVLGTGGRGGSLARSFARLADAEVACVCDVDEPRRSEAARNVAGEQERAPREVTDLRRALDDSEIDAVVIAMPDHWHAPAAILAMQAGKHVYVEKPGSHNPREGEMIVAAARRYDRVVQMGNQRRSWPGIVEGIERVRGGALGPVHYARAWYANARGSIGQGQATSVPQWLDYELWQGPAPRTPYRDNILHYNWHWFWNWGTGEAGNNGVHGLDLCRWGLQVDHPIRVTSSGGRYFWRDDQETPDTHMITFDFPGGKTVVWEGLSCNRRGIEGSGFGASFHGEGGTMVIEGLGYRLYDRDGKAVESAGDGAQELGVTGPGFDIDESHLTNFVRAIRTGEALRAPIEDGQKSTLLCHLGNIAQRTRRALQIDAPTGRIVDDAEAAALWGREYAAGWEPRV